MCAPDVYLAPELKWRSLMIACALRETTLNRNAATNHSRGETTLQSDPDSRDVFSCHGKTIVLVVVHEATIHNCKQPSRQSVRVEMERGTGTRWVRVAGSSARSLHNPSTSYVPSVCS